MTELEKRKQRKEELQAKIEKEKATYQIFMKSVELQFTILEN